MFLSRHISPGEGRKKVTGVRVTDYFLSEGKIERINPQSPNEVKAKSERQMARESGTPRKLYDDFGTTPGLAKKDYADSRVIMLLGQPTRVPRLRLSRWG